MSAGSSPWRGGGEAPFVLLLRCEVAAFIFYAAADCKRLQKTAKDCEIETREKSRKAQSIWWLRVFEKYFSISAISSLASRAASLAVALASHTNRTVSLLFTLNSSLFTVRNVSEAPRDMRIMRVRHARRIDVGCQMSISLLSTITQYPLYIGHIYVIKYTTYI